MRGHIRARRAFGERFESNFVEQPERARDRVCEAPKSACYDQSMNKGYELDRLGNAELLSGLSALVKRGNELTAELLAHLAEMDRRRLHLDLGYSSLFAYCIEKLRLSEPAAGRRIAAARVCRRFPEAFELVARGDLHLSALCALQPHLNPTNAAELFQVCRHKTRRQVEEILAGRFPRADVGTSIRRLPQPKHAEPSSPPEKPRGSVASATTSAGPSAKPITSPPLPQPVTPKPQIKPISPERYGVHFTASSTLRDKIEQARALASHRVAPGDLAALIELALDALIRELLKQRFAVGRKPREMHAPLSPGDSAGFKSRHIPAGVAREVFERDQGRCTFVSRDGRRCNERCRLEIEHIHPWSQNGPATVENLCLLCRAHNLHQARLKFGAEFIQRAIEGKQGGGLVRDSARPQYSANSRHDLRLEPRFDPGTLGASASGRFPSAERDRVPPDEFRGRVIALLSARTSGHRASLKGVARGRSLPTTAPELGAAQASSP
jgi:HNH endonuclease